VIIIKANVNLIGVKHQSINQSINQSITFSH